MTDEEIIAKGFKPFHGDTRPTDFDPTGGVLLEDGFHNGGRNGNGFRDDWNWSNDNNAYPIIGYHSKKPNKIVIPDGPASEWAIIRWHDLWEGSGKPPHWELGAHLIAMLEEEPIDEDLIEARRIAAPFIDDTADSVCQGGWDSHDVVCASLAALKRGRELGKVGDQDHD